MRLMLAVAMLCVSATTSIAAEVELPNEWLGPLTALAKAERDGNDLVLRVKLLDGKMVTRARAYQYFVIEKQVKDGVETCVQVPKTAEINVTMMVPSAWKEVVVPLGGETTLTDVSGTTVQAREIEKRLQDQKPILVSTSGAVDAWYLQTTHPDTLILLTKPERLVALPQPEATAAAPAAEAPPTADVASPPAADPPPPASAPEKKTSAPKAKRKKK